MSDFGTTATNRVTEQQRLIGGINVTALTGAVTLTNASSHFQLLDPGGASRDVTLPGNDAGKGMVFVFGNTADDYENLVVKNAAASTIVTVAPGEYAIVGNPTGAGWSLLLDTALAPIRRATTQAIDMADAQVALVYGTAGAGQVKLVADTLFVDANSGATEDLLLPVEASSAGVVLDIFNTGGESIVVKEDSDTTTIVTIATAKSARVACNGTTWYAILGA